MATNKRTQFLFDLPVEHFCPPDPGTPTKEEMDRAIHTLRRGSFHVMKFYMEGLRQDFRVLFEEMSENSDEFLSDDEISDINRAIAGIDSGEITTADIEAISQRHNTHFYVIANRDWVL